MNLFSRDRIRFDRNELAGSFGDIGTDLPLIVGIILAAGLDSGSRLYNFRTPADNYQESSTAFPMPMQPLKQWPFWSLLKKLRALFLWAAVLQSCHHASADHHRRINILCQMDPRSVVRGIQFGLGLSLASLALKDYIPSMGVGGYGLAFVGFVLMLALWGNRRIPPGLFVIGIGVILCVCGRTADSIQ